MCKGYAVVSIVYYEVQVVELMVSGKTEIINGVKWQSQSDEDLPFRYKVEITLEKFSFLVLARVYNIFLVLVSHIYECPTSAGPTEMENV